MTLTKQASARRRQQAGAIAPARRARAVLDARPDLARHRDLMWTFQDVYSLLGRSFDRRVKKSGLSRAQWRVLSSLLREDGQTQTDLAERVQIEKAPLGRLIDRMEEAGFVARRADPNDRRVRRVYLTERIDTLMPVLVDAAEALFANAFKDISQKDLATLGDRLSRIRENLLSEEASKPQA